MINNDEILIEDKYEIITSYEEIERISESILLKDEFIAVDLEFYNISSLNNTDSNNKLDELYSGFCCKSEKKWILSLIQIASPKLNKVFIFDIDFYSFKNKLFNLKKIFLSEKIIKIFHDYRQDLNVIFYNLDIYIKNIFDTQIADMFLNSSSSYKSYASLVYEILNIKLNKECQDFDWSIRPLKEEQFLYAANDVFFLLKIYKYLVEKLHENSRYEWKIEYMNELESKRRIETHKVFIYITHFNMIIDLSNLNILYQIEALINFFEKTNKIFIRDYKRKISFHYIKNIIEAKKNNTQKLQNIFAEFENWPENHDQNLFFQSILDILSVSFIDKENEFNKEKRGLFIKIINRLENNKIQLDFEFTNILLILKFMLKKESYKYNISPQLILDKHEIMEFIYKFQKMKYEKSFNISHKTNLEFGFRFLIFGSKAMKFLNGEIKLFFSQEKNELEFE